MVTSAHSSTRREGPRLPSASTPAGPRLQTNLPEAGSTLAVLKNELISESAVTTIRPFRVTMIPESSGPAAHV